MKTNLVLMREDVNNLHDVEIVGPDIIKFPDLHYGGTPTTFFDEISDFSLEDVRKLATDLCKIGMVPFDVFAESGIHLTSEMGKVVAEVTRDVGGAVGDAFGSINKGIFGSLKTPLIAAACIIGGVLILKYTSNNSNGNKEGSKK